MAFPQPMLSLWQCQQQCQKNEERRRLYTRTHKPVVITKSPDKPNLAYPVHEKSEMEEVFDGLIEECELNACKWKKAHHFCWTYDSCSELFSLFHRKLSKEITDPVGHSNTSRFRLADKFTASNPLALKNVVVTLFSKPQSRL